MWTNFDVIANVLLMVGIIWYDLMMTDHDGGWAHVARVFIICVVCCFAIIGTLPEDMIEPVSIALACFIPGVFIWWLYDRYKYNKLRGYVDE